MSRSQSSEINVTKNTSIASLKDIDPDAVKALNASGIHNVGQLKKTTLDVPLIVHRAMSKRQISASLTVFALRRYQSTPLTRSSPISSRQPLVPSSISSQA